MWPVVVACACPTWPLRKQMWKKIWGNLLPFHYESESKMKSPDFHLQSFPCGWVSRESDFGLAPTTLLERSPHHPCCNWRTLPSSHTPSLPILPRPFPTLPACFWLSPPHPPLPRSPPPSPFTSYSTGKLPHTTPLNPTPNPSPRDTNRNSRPLAKTTPGKNYP